MTEPQRYFYRAMVCEAIANKLRECGREMHAKAWEQRCIFEIAKGLKELSHEMEKRTQA